MKIKNLLITGVVCLGFATTIIAQVPSYVPTDGLVAYYPFNGNANDESGNGNNGTVNGATLTTDRFGNADSAYSFDGVDDWIVSSIEQSSTYSVSVWVNINDNTSYNAFVQHKDNCTRGGGYLLETNSTGILRHLTYDCGSCSIPACTNELDFNAVSYGQIQTGEWNLFTVTSDGSGNYKYYINNQLIGNISEPNINIDYGAKPFSIGKHHDGDNLFYSNGILDDIGLWNRALTEQEISNIYNNCTPPTAPTGDTQQTFCEASTIADLTATGDNIQWYDSATGGNLLNSTTALTDGQMVYASQAVNGCESTERLEVTVSIQDITITASATEVCAGESSMLNVALTNASGTFAEGQLVNEFNHTINTNASQQFPTTVGLNYRLEIEGNVTWGTYCPALAYDPAYVLSGFYGTTEATPRDFACNDAMYSSIFCDSPGLRPIPDQYDGVNHSYDYYFTANSNQISVGFFDNLLGDNCGSVTFRLFENSTPPSQNSLVWSTGDTTETITVTPTETTEYWVDVTTNGVTCREYITIDVTAPVKPTADNIQSFNNGDTLDDLIVTGTNLQWYANSSDTNSLPSSTALVNGTTYYVSETVNGCESERLAITVTTTLGIDDEELKDFRLYPNPTKDKLYFNSSQIINKIRIYNALGQLLGEYLFNETNGEINLGEIENGVYFIKVNDLTRSYSIIKS
jgi:hypothetical protein